MELTGQKMTSYLETVSKLEASVYEQEQSCATAKKKVVYKKPKQIFVSKPQKKTIEEPTKPEKSYSGFWIFLIVFAIFYVSFALAFTELKGGFMAVSIVFLPIGAVIGAVILIRIRIKWKKEEENYYAAMREYEHKIEQENENYQSKMKKYKIELQNSDKKYTEETAKAREAFEFAEGTLKQLTQPLEDTKNILKKYYELDVIHPKYRNLAAVSTICEYFQTGRCTELTGPDGAYNLYEAELRQNLIINRLENVIDNLEQIKTNQYFLYMELKKASDSIASIGMTASALLDVSSRNAAANTITAYCTEVTAFNSTALTSLALFG